MLKRNHNQHLLNLETNSPLRTRSGKIRKILSEDDINFNQTPKSSLLIRSQSIDTLLSEEFDKTLLLDDNQFNDKTFCIEDNVEKNLDLDQSVSDLNLNDFEVAAFNPIDNIDLDHSVLDYNDFDAFNPIDNFEYIDIDYNKIDRRKLLITSTQQNKPKLCENGYFYTIEKSNKKAIIWRCERTGNKTTPKCPGRAYTIGYCQPVNVTIGHNHELDLVQEEVNFYLTKIIHRAKITNDEPKSIIKTCLVGISKEAAKSITRANALTQRIIRTRQKKVDYGPNPSTIHEIDIPVSLRTSFRN